MFVRWCGHFGSRLISARGCIALEPTRDLFLKEHTLLSRICISLPPPETLSRFEGWVFMSRILFDKKLAGYKVHNEGQKVNIDMSNLKRHRAAQGC